MGEWDIFTIENKDKNYIRLQKTLKQEESGVKYVKCWGVGGRDSSISSEIIPQNEAEIKTFSEKQKLKDMVANRPAFQGMLKKSPSKGRKWYTSQPLRRKSVGAGINEGKVKSFFLLN